MLDTACVTLNSLFTKIFSRNVFKTIYPILYDTYAFFFNFQNTQQSKITNFEYGILLFPDTNLLLI